ncbi:hypothetical protein GIB67_003266 [Kingdonia uniflora]|uniref:Uncharacterized protein n=1 Tax=Kingdonia uniflora TaxID=39325 RepID=A0A7J7LXV7_9MAGN|nr:hypothetical protein GIB67_003266 [Kingdonia uniflora]
MLGDVSKMHLVEETVKDAKKISLFIYNHKHVLHLIRKQTKGTDITYGVLEDAEDGFDDPPLAHTSRTNTASHCSQGGASSSLSTTRHLQDSSDDDDYDVDANYNMGDVDDDGIDSGSDEDI